VAIAAPAVPLVIVHAWANQDSTGEWETGSEIFPVLAIQACVASEFSRSRLFDDLRRPATVKEALASGWSHDWIGVAHDLLIHSAEWGGIVTASQGLDGVNTAWRSFVAPDWAPDTVDDYHTFSAEAAQLEAEALAKAKGATNGAEVLS
jgi:hypothetical protein